MVSSLRCVTDPPISVRSSSQLPQSRASLKHDAISRTALEPSAYAIRSASSTRSTTAPSTTLT